MYVSKWKLSPSSNYWTIDINLQISTIYSEWGLGGKITYVQLYNNAMSDVYRCPEILNAEPGCNYITDPRDPTCCRIPDCAPVNPNNPEPHPIPPKTYQGQIVGTPGM